MSFAGDACTKNALLSSLRLQNSQIWDEFELPHPLPLEDVPELTVSLRSELKRTAYRSFTKSSTSAKVTVIIYPVARNTM